MRIFSQATWFAISSLAVAILVTSAQARHEPSWPYDKLFKEADVVVIVEATDTHEAKDKLVADKHIKEMETTCKIFVAMKGTIQHETITLYHYQSGEIDAITSPSYVEFDTSGPPVTVRRQYLLFLKQRADGRYEPVTGQYDAALSVRLLSLPE